MRLRRVALIGGLLAIAAPASAQEINARVGKLEFEMRAVQRKVFPGGAGGYVEPDIRAPDASRGADAGTPASNPDIDLSQRVSALESQMSRLTGDVEQNSHRLRVLEDQFAAYRRATDARLAAGADSGTARPAKGGDDAMAPPVDTAVDSSVPRGRPSSRPVRAPTPDEDAQLPAGAHGDGFDGPYAGTRRPPSTMGTRTARLAAVEKPDTGDAPEDAYLYGYRLYQAKLYPEAETQLKQVVATYPKSKRASYAQNLLGRSYLEEGKPSLASIAFYDNYKKMPDGDRAPDSLYYLAQSLMKLNKPADACKVYAELGDVYAGKITPEMKSNVAKGRVAAKCQ